MLLDRKLRDKYLMPISAIHSPTKALLFFALLYRCDDCPFEFIRNEIEQKWGKSVAELSPKVFPMKDYYSKEMGSPLSRIYLVIEGKFERETLVEAKNWSMEKESETAKEGNRTINIDPGLICLEQLLLISTKPYSHRIYLKDNLYAELTYQFQDKKFTPLPWTYPDYVELEVIDFFTNSRKFLK